MGTLAWSYAARCDDGRLYVVQRDGKAWLITVFGPDQLARHPEDRDVVDTLRLGKLAAQAYADDVDAAHLVRRAQSRMTRAILHAYETGL